MGLEIWCKPQSENFLTAWDFFLFSEKHLKSPFFKFASESFVCKWPYAYVLHHVFFSSFCFYLFVLQNNKFSWVHTLVENELYALSIFESYFVPFCILDKPGCTPKSIGDVKYALRLVLKNYPSSFENSAFYKKIFRDFLNVLQR